MYLYVHVCFCAQSEWRRQVSTLAVRIKHVCLCLYTCMCVSVYVRARAGIASIISEFPSIHVFSVRHTENARCDY